jgi:hypothetical protein
MTYKQESIWTPTDLNDLNEDAPPLVSDEGDEHCDVGPEWNHCGLGASAPPYPEDDTHPEWRDEPPQGGEG